MKVIICGGRKHPPFTSEQVQWLDSLHEAYHFSEVIEGGAYGADRHAREWAYKRKIATVTFWANWGMIPSYAAGPVRNTKMLAYLAWVSKESKEACGLVQFSGGKGTADMVSKAVIVGVRIYTWSET